MRRLDPTFIPHLALWAIALIVVLALPTETQADRRRRLWTTYGSDRGRLVVACDMTSDTCSDGRKIVTERATPVPCETSPGVWEIVPADVGCYSVRGLESWAANTSYLSWGAELDRSPWQVTGSQNTLTPLEEGGYRLCHGVDANNSGLVQLLGDPPEVYSLAVIGRRNTGSSLLLGAWSTQQITPLPDAWGPIVRANAAPLLEGSTTAYLYPRPGGQQLCIDLLAAWLTKSDTPGRACWGGEAPVTCARDFHRLPATGFPTTTGEISWVMRLERVPRSGDPLRGIISADGVAVPNRLSITRDGEIRVYTGETAYVTGPLSWEPGRSYTIQLVMDEDEWRVVRDGALVGSTPPLGSMDWGATVMLGNLLDGSLRSLRIRSAE